MTTDEFVDAIKQAFASIPNRSGDNAGTWMAERAALRAKYAGRAYEVARDQQGFEAMTPRELVNEIEDELADAAAWAVAMNLVMQRLGADDAHISPFLYDLTALMGHIAWFRATAGDIEDGHYAATTTPGAAA